MSTPQDLTVTDLIDTITDLVITEGRRPTVDDVIAEVLARLTARLQISADPPKPSISSMRPSARRATAQGLNSSRMANVVSSPSTQDRAAHSLNSLCTTVPSTGASMPRVPHAGSSSRSEKESLPIVCSGKHYVVVRGRRIGIFPEPFDYVKTLIDGVPNNRYKGFKTKQAAAEFYNEEKSKGNVMVIRTSVRDDNIFGPADVEQL
ncbi:hypothetical protein JOM56_010085 [Amanita muscaria]